MSAHFNQIRFLGVVKFLKINKKVYFFFKKMRISPLHSSAILLLYMHNLVVIVKGKYPFPYRTRKSSPYAPMILLKAGK